MKFSQRSKLLALICLTLVTIATIAILTYLLSYRIERTIDVVIRVSEVDAKQFEVESLQGHLFNPQNSVVLQIDRNFYRGHIQQVAYQPDRANFAITISGINYHLAPGVSIKAKVVINYQAVWDALLTI